MGCHFLFQGIFLPQGLSPHLLYWQQVLYHWDTWEALALLINFEYFWLGTIPGVVNMVTLIGLSFQALLESGSRQCECDPSQQPGQVSIPDIPPPDFMESGHFALSA